MEIKVNSKKFGEVVIFIDDELVFYCPILDNIWIYRVQFWKDNRKLFDTNGLIYLGVL